ncbi:MAG: hypothetical protein E7554_02040 [Ruminococcaceae bacterium]|nr:hypothetical protein [Oscillospiraceae bacterium]
MAQDNYGSRGMNVRVSRSGIPLERRSKSFIFIALAAALVLVNLMLGLFTSVSGGCFQVLEMGISDEYISVFSGDSYQLSADSLITGGGETNYIWESDDPSLVTVDENGLVTGVSEGKANVTVTETNSGKKVTCAVTVLRLSEMSVAQTEYTLGVGEPASISAFSGNGNAVEYASSNPGIATVDTEGNITTVSPGDVEITVSGFGCETKTCTVSVKKAPSKITFETSLDICVGETRVVTAKTAEDEHAGGFVLSTDSAIIQIAEDGTMTALSEGTATLVAETYNGATGKATVTVRHAPTSMSAELADKSLYTGNTTQVKAKDNTGFCRQYFYSTSDPSVATVDADGVVTATGKGEATISCETFNGVKDTCKVSVKVVDYTKPYTSKLVARNCQELAAKYPELIKLDTIGTSTCGTDIILVRMGTGEKKAIITGGIHSREDITVNYVMRCIEEYAEAFYSNSGRYGSFKISDMLKEWTLYIVPVMNPDGIDIANDGMIPLYKNGEPLSETELFDYKNTSTGVNLNRNFPFEWGYEDPDINATTPDIDSYIGKSEASEPETKAIIRLCEENEFEWMFSFHIKGNMLYWADTVNKNAEKAELMANRLVVNCKFNLMRTSTVAGASGGMENWFRQQYNKPGFCIELMEDQWSSEVNKYFEKKVNWAKTRYAIVLGMRYG